MRRLPDPDQDSSPNPNRRAVLAAGASVAALAGCIGSVADDGDDESPDVPDDLDRFEHDYEIDSSAGEPVPLVPVDDAHEWYETDAARFLDARGEGDYNRERIPGAVRSTAGHDLGDPVTEWPADERIVTYCACPHSLALQRGARLVGEGYVNVFALEGGLDAWIDEGHPLEGYGVDG